MAKGDFKQRVVDQLADALDENLDDDDLKEAIWEELDLKDLVRETFQDKEVKAALKAKFKELVLRKIKEVESLEDLQADFDLSEELPKDCQISALLAEDDEFKTAFKAKLGKLILDDVENVDNLNELFGDDFDLDACLPKGYKLKDIVKEIFQTDEEIQNHLKEILKKQLEDVSTDDLPEWDTFIKMIDLDARLKEAVQNQEANTVISQRIKEVIEEWFKDDFNIDNIPDELLDPLIADKLAELQKNGELRKQLDPKLAEKIIEAITDELDDSDSRLMQVVVKNPALHETANQSVSQLMVDPVLKEKLKDALMNKITKDPRLVAGLIDRVFGKVAETMVEKLLGEKKPF